MSTSTVVTSVGNSWIICRSKTYSGRIYYFNTLTGEAAWNLSESEIEKAKKRTSILQTQTGFQIDDCPEPKDSPQDESSQIQSHSNVQKTPQNIVPSKVYNKQIINNQYPRPSFPCTGTFYPLNAVNPIQYNMAVTPTVNPNVWNLNPQPIFVAPNVISQQPVINTTLNNYDYVPVTNTTVPLSSRFKNLSESQRKNRVCIGNKFRGSKNNFRNRFHNSRNKMDLRLLLSSKKRKQNIGNNDHNEVEDFQQGQFDVKPDSIIQNTDKRTTFHHLIFCDDNDDDDDICLEENQSKIQSSKDSLDISPLRKLLQVEKSFDVWYIVLDSNVLLNNINFLKILISSDNQCRLMVPQAVMNKIQKATNSSLRTLAHRAAYFISQQVDTNIAVIDQINEEESNDDKTAILNCCSKLTNQGYPVVLLTDDIELHNLEDNTPFQVLTVKQAKNILSKTMSNAPKSNSLEDLALSQSRSIVITIPNDVNKTNLNYVQQNKCESAMIYPTEVHSAANIVPKDGAFENVAGNIVETNKMRKNSDDVGFQKNEINLLHDTSDKIIDVLSSKDNENKPYKNSRSILNRSLSNDVHIKLDSTEKKKPKWNKRRTKSISNQSKVNLTEQIKSVDITKEYNLSSNENLAPYVSSDSQNQNCNINCEKSCFEERSLNENSMIEKASTSGTLYKSNNVEMDNNKIVAAKDIVEKKCLLKNSDIEDENVMFEVTSSDMEECLRRKCDEWISRFVQIIEEACTQVLQQDPPFILDTMLPPWTLYEATECIKRKFYNDNDIVDAANKLLNVLFEIGGLRGKIKSNISPQKYMEMYSYGVYLIDALQGLLTNSEDLQIAAESLSKLLSDIQNTNLYSDSRFEDSFTDVLPETIDDVAQDKLSNEEKIMEPVNSIEDKASNKSEYKIVTFTNNSPTKKTKTESIGAPGSYNLRSQRKKLLQEEEEFSNKTKFVRNIDPESSFFMSLRLKKNVDTNNDLDVNKSLNDDVNIEDRDKVETVGTENVCENVNKTNENVDIGSPEHENNISNEQRVIRNFTLCPEFENRLKEKQKVYDSWTSKNEAYQNDMISEESEQFDYDSMENQYYGCDYEMYDTEYMSEVNSLDRCTENEQSVICAAEKTNIHFKDIIEKIEHNIRETFSSVHRFCEKCYTTLSSNDRNFKKREMQHAAKETYLYLSNLCDALNNILSRESIDSAYKIQELLKLEELQEIILEDDDLEGYRNFVTKCIEQGNVLKDSVQLVIDASKE